MEIFCRNIPEHVREKHLKRTIAPVLNDLSIYTYHCRRFGRDLATLTICDAAKAEIFLNCYGASNGREDRRLQLFGRVILVSRSRNSPDEYLLRSLAEEELTRTRRGPKPPMSDGVAAKPQKSFGIASLSCGYWDYDGNGPVFVNCSHHPEIGVMTFGRSALHISTEKRAFPQAIQHLEYDYSIMNGPVYLGNSTSPTVTLTLEVAPKMFETRIDTAMQALGIRNRGPSKTRVCSLNIAHGQVASTCFTYQVTLRERGDLQVMQALKRERHIPKLFPWSTRIAKPRLHYSTLMCDFLSSLDSQQFPFRLKFQLQMLVWNGYLSPLKVTELFAQARQILLSSGLDRAVQVLRGLPRKLQYPGPEVDRSDFDTEFLEKLMSTINSNGANGGCFNLDTETVSPNTVSIHRATITPVGRYFYLYGPHQEPKNRVLRRYAKYTDYFLRVQFTEETGDLMRFDQNASLDEIYHQRFKSVLLHGITIGGRHFEFLGSSHSSLRSHLCWFMAPFILETGKVVDAKEIISNLGDFSHIRSPAKCAARIGQAFSDTLTSIMIPKEAVSTVADVKRGTRVFSDGVGTISTSLMHKVWAEYVPRARLKPTVFQIRFAGNSMNLILSDSLPLDALYP